MDKAKYLANREWAKDIKFNGHWYHLQSLFDKAINKSKTRYDFNDVYDSQYDFNNQLNDGDLNCDANVNYDFNVSIEHDPNSISHIDDDDLYETIINLIPYVSNTNISDQDAVNNFVIEAINEYVYKDHNSKQTFINFNINYYFFGNKSKPYPGSRININPNIIGNSIEDLIYNALVKYSHQVSGFEVGRNRIKSNDPFEKSETYDISVKYNNTIYFYEVKSGEGNPSDPYPTSIYSRHMRMSDNQFNDRARMNFILCNYLHDEKTYNKVNITKVVLAEGKTIRINKK